MDSNLSPDAQISERLRAHLASQGLSTSDLSELTSLLAGGLMRARERFAGIDVSPADFTGYVLDRLGDADPTVALSRLQMEDLYFACACLQAHPRALVQCERDLVVSMSPVLRAQGFGDAIVDEALQVLRQQLVGVGDREALLGQYAGRGPLRSWLRVVAVRLALKSKRREQRHLGGAEADEQLLARAATPQDDPELQYIKRVYREEFREAFGASLKGMPARQRNLLQQHYLDRLSTYEIGRLYRVNQATASRWLARARDELLAATRSAMMDKLNVGRDDLESILRLVASQLDVTLQEAARSPSDAV